MYIPSAINLYITDRLKDNVGFYRAVTDIVFDDMRLRWLMTVKKERKKRKELIK